MQSMDRLDQLLHTYINVLLHKYINVSLAWLNLRQQAYSLFADHLIHIIHKTESASSNVMYSICYVMLNNPYFTFYFGINYFM